MSTLGLYFPCLNTRPFRVPTFSNPMPLAFILENRNPCTHIVLQLSLLNQNHAAMRTSDRKDPLFISSPANVELTLQNKPRPITLPHQCCRLFCESRWIKFKFYGKCRGYHFNSATSRIIHLVSPKMSNLHDPTPYMCHVDRRGSGSLWTRAHRFWVFISDWKTTSDHILNSEFGFWYRLPLIVPLIEPLV